MPSPRLMRVTVTTPRAVRGPEMRSLCALPVQQRLRLDAPHQVVVQKVLSFPDVPEPPTTVVFQYTYGFADSADYNDGPGDIEGDIIAAVKEAFEVAEVFATTIKFDCKCY